MTVGTSVGLSVFLLVNKFYYWLAGSEDKHFGLKSSLYVQDKLLRHENYCFVC